MRKLMEAINIYELTRSEFEYKGVTYYYQPIKEHEPAHGEKIFHYFKDSEGGTGYINWTPYDFLSDKDFENWIIMGRPKSLKGKKLNSKNLEFEASLFKASEHYYDE